MQRNLAAALAGPDPIFAPLCLDPLTARIAHDAGFHFGYLSGGALGYSYAVSEALLTLSEIAEVTRRLTVRSPLGVIVDAGVGFGDPVHVARTVWELEAAGACAIEIEDQVAPKRVSHHRGIEHLVEASVMVQKVEQAVAARRDSGFLIIARTGAVKNESFDAALARLERYRRAGADVLMLLPEDVEQMHRARDALDGPLAAIASLDARSAQDWKALGWDLIVDPFTAQVLACRAVEEAYRSFAARGHTGADVRQVFETYRRLPSMAGLDVLYGIEDVTTEASSSGRSSARAGTAPLDRDRSQWD